MIDEEFRPANRIIRQPRLFRRAHYLDITRNVTFRAQIFLSEDSQ